MPKQIKKVLFHQISLFVGLAMIVFFSSIFGAILLRQVLAAPAGEGIISTWIGASDPSFANTLFHGQQKIYEKILGLPETAPFPTPPLSVGSIMQRIGYSGDGSPGNTLISGQKAIYNAVTSNEQKIWAYNSILGQWEDFGELDYCKLNPYGDKANITAWTCYNSAGDKYTYAGGVLKNNILLAPYNTQYDEPKVGSKWVTTDQSSRDNFCMYCKGAAYALLDYGGTFLLGPTAGTIPMPGGDSCVQGSLLNNVRPSYLKCVFGGYSAMRIQATQPIGAP
ncbi:MAG: hypothetical protein ABH896_04630 [Candidatus Jacksonbacteria bacterium]